MDQDEVKSVLQSEIQNALGYQGNELSAQRERLLAFYEGDLPLGNNIPDRAQVKSRKVLEVVNWLLADLIPIFTSSDNIISFEPRRPQDEQLAKNITMYINYIIREDNAGFRLIVEWIKTALVQKNGFMKVAYEHEPQIEMNTFTRLGDAELAALMDELDTSSDRYEILQQIDYPDPSVPPPNAMLGAPPNAMLGAPPGAQAAQSSPASGAPPGMMMPPMPNMLAQRSANAPPGASQPPSGPQAAPPPPAGGMMPPMPTGGPQPPPSGALPGQPMPPASPPLGTPPVSQVPAPPPMLHDLRVRVTNTEGRVRLYHVLPEQVLLSKRADGTVMDGRHFVAHYARKTASDLRALGYDDDLIEEALGWDEPEWSPERIYRYSRDGDSMSPDDRTDKAMRSTWITEAYLPIDEDGDGYAELRRIVAGADGAVIFEDEECDDVPLINLTAIIEPGKAIGSSVAEYACELQSAETAILRGTLDSLYFSVVPRPVLNENKLTENSYDDLLDHSPGGAIRVADDGAITWMEIPFQGQAVMPILEYLDTVTQTRTGVGTQNSVVSPDALNNQTAAGVAMTQNAGAKQIELMARVIAETGFRELGKKILGLVVRHEDKARMIRLNGNFVTMDPRDWHTNFDVNIHVGLGTGNKVQTIQNIEGIQKVQQAIISLQGGPGGMVSPQNVYAGTCRMTEAMGYKDNIFFTDPAQAGPMPPHPNPEAMKAQAQIQAIQAQSQADIAAQKSKDDFQMQQDTLKFQHAMQMQQQKHQAEMQMEQERESLKLQIEMMRQQQKTAIALKGTLTQPETDALVGQNAAPPVASPPMVQGMPPQSF